MLCQCSFVQLPPWPGEGLLFEGTEFLPFLLNLCLAPLLTAVVSSLHLPTPGKKMRRLWSRASQCWVWKSHPLSQLCYFSTSETQVPPSKQAAGSHLGQHEVSLESCFSYKLPCRSQHCLTVPQHLPTIPALSIPLGATWARFPFRTAACCCCSY